MVNDFVGVKERGNPVSLLRWFPIVILGAFGLAGCAPQEREPPVAERFERERVAREQARLEQQRQQERQLADEAAARAARSAGLAKVDAEKVERIMAACKAAYSVKPDAPDWARSYWETCLSNKRRGVESILERLGGYGNYEGLGRVNLETKAELEQELVKASDPTRIVEPQLIGPYKGSAGEAKLQVVQIIDRLNMIALFEDRYSAPVAVLVTGYLTDGRADGDNAYGTFRGVGVTRVGGSTLHTLSWFSIESFLEKTASFPSPKSQAGRDGSELGLSDPVHGMQKVTEQRGAAFK